MLETILRLIGLEKFARLAYNYLGEIIDWLLKEIGIRDPKLAQTWVRSLVGTALAAAKELPPPISFIQ